MARGTTRVVWDPVMAHWAFLRGRWFCQRPRAFAFPGRLKPVDLQPLKFAKMGAGSAPPHKRKHLLIPEKPDLLISLRRSRKSVRVGAAPVAQGSLQARRSSAQQTVTPLPLDEHRTNMSETASDVISSTLAGVAAHVKDAIKLYEETTSLPYDEVPPELCQAQAGEREIDLSAWSLLVNDSALERIAASDRDRIKTLAKQRSITQVGNHVKEMGLSAALEGIDTLGVARFDAKSMVAWREKQKLEQMKAEAYDRAKGDFMAEQGLTSLNVTGAGTLRDGGIAAIATQCRCLRSLNISGADRVTDVAIRCLSVNCTSLTQLNLSGCTGISGPGLATLGECCPKLLDLNLSKCKQVGHWILTRIFRGCHELETLSLRLCSRVGDAELKELAMGCPALTKLNLHDCNQISDTGLVEVARRCNGLKVLELSRSALHFKVGDVTLLGLGQGCRELQRLSLSGCDGVTDVGISWMTAGCPGLEHFDITGCVKVSNAGLTSLAERCPLLSFFCISGLKYVTDVGVARLGSGCPQLTHLDLSGVVKLSDGNRRDFALTGIQAFAQGCTALKTLVLDGCFQVSQTALGAVGGGLHALERLSMCHCPALTFNGLSKVAAGCPSLTDLNLSRCGGAVTDSALAVFARDCRRLRKLTLKGVVGIPPPLGAVGISAVCVNCKELDCLDLEDIPDLEDSAFVCFHENQMLRLSRVNLANCPNISGVGIQWLVDGCPALSCLNVKGTKVTLTTLNIVRERYPYNFIKVCDNFFGLAHLPRLKERLAIKRYATLHNSARRIQGCFRRDTYNRRRLSRLELKGETIVPLAPLPTRTRMPER